MGRTKEGVGVGAVIVVGCVVLAALGLGMWKFGWFLTNANANRQAHVIRNGYSNQQTLREQIRANIANAAQIETQVAELGATDTAVPPLQAQWRAVANIVCQDADEVSGDPLPADQAAWVGKHCAAGSVIAGDTGN